MNIAFTKMHGLGNDFVVIHSRGAEPPAETVIRRLADRRRGIGFDQLLWLEPPRTAGGDIYYRIFNADGSEAEQCGNGARCIARLVAGNDRDELMLEHGGGTSQARIMPDGQVSIEICVPEFTPARVPFAANRAADRYVIETAEGQIEAGVVSLGNPHAVVQVENVDDAPVATLGPQLESHARFPNRANIGFMQVVASDRIRLRVFERGVGETSACGTGACAAAVIGQRWGMLGDAVYVDLPGGTVRIDWKGPGSSVWLTGEAIAVFSGTVET